MKLFVYGTLKSGFENHHFLENSTLLEKDVMLDGFSLYLFIKIPFAVKDSEEEFIIGEIWDINSDTEQKLDILEGVDSGVYVKYYTKYYFEDMLIYITPEKKVESIKKMKKIKNGIFL